MYPRIYEEIEESFEREKKYRDSSPFTLSFKLARISGELGWLLIEARGQYRTPSSLKKKIYESRKFSCKSES